VALVAYAAKDSAGQRLIDQPILNATVLLVIVTSVLWSCSGRACGPASPVDGDFKDPRRLRIVPSASGLVALSGSGTKRRLRVGQSMLALPGYFRRQLVLLLPGRHLLRFPGI
jgi:hypothetical protein